MKLVPLDVIVVPPNRQRAEFDEDALLELSRSIGEIGLLHPIVIDSQLNLIAGERRLRALKRCAMLRRPVHFEGIPLGDNVPCVMLEELSENDRYQIELEENLVRADLTWQEKALAVRRLAELKSGVPGGRAPGVAAEIAQDLHGRADGGFSDDVRKMLIVAQHLDNKEIAGASNVREAYKMLKTAEAIIQARAAASSKSVGEEWLNILHMDAVEFCLTYQGPKFDVLCTDPPYGMGADSFGDSGGKMLVGHAYNDERDSTLSMLERWITAVSNIMAPNSHAYQFCDFDVFPILRERWTAEGFKVFRTPIIWHKPSGYRAPWPDKGPQRKYECILYAVRGEKPTRRLAGDVITIQNDNESPHAARKPVGLYQDLLSRSCLPGERVLDTFAGSGPIIPAAKALGLQCTVVDCDEASVGMCYQRLGEQQ